MRALIVGLLAAFGSFLALSGAAAAPPPPPPPGAIERATAIVSPPAEGDLQAYVALFTDDVSVSEDGKDVVRGRGDLLTYLRARSAVHHQILKVSYGNPILVVESLNNYPDKPKNGVVYDCCFWARVASYHMDQGGKVDRVLYLGSGSFWGRPENPE